MDSASLQFVGFGLLVALLSNCSRSPVWRSVVLFAATVVFLGMLAPSAMALVPLAGFLVVGYAGLMLLERGWTRAAVPSLSLLLLAYIWLKKYTVLPEAAFLRFPYFTLGLSYILFRVLHLLIEARDSAQPRHISPGAYLLYTLNFTTFVSGPIQRYDAFAEDQFAIEPIPLGPGVIGLQMERIIRGLFKVNVLAMLLDAVRVDALAQMSQALPLPLKLWAAFKLATVYPIFLYANFSGYIDIVIALARLMRVRLPENFDRPFSASSFLDFWNRWHITLSTWLKTYVYNPLLTALMRRISTPAVQPYLGVFCFFVTFFLIGVWHGRTSEFVVFGVLQGAGVAINKLWQLRLTKLLGRKGYRELASQPVYVAFGRGLTFAWFAFGSLWFWGDWKQIDMIFSALTPVSWAGVWLAIWLCATLVLELWERTRAALLAVRTAEGPVLTGRYARMVYASALGVAVFVALELLNQPAPGIVYKAF